MRAARVMLVMGRFTPLWLLQQVRSIAVQFISFTLRQIQLKTSAGGWLGVWETVLEQSVWH